MNSVSLPFSEACERNKQPILDVLQQVLGEVLLAADSPTAKTPFHGDNKPTVLEIGSGTGQHAVYFAAALDRWNWQPSDRPQYLHGLRQRMAVEGRDNIFPPVLLDVLSSWPAGPFHAVFSANTAHIMSWPAVQAMFSGVGACLAVDGRFVLYGPFNNQGRFTSASNEAFDHQLRLEDPQMGIRDLAELELLAQKNQMKLTNQYDMPANNQVLVFAKARDL